MKNLEILVLDIEEKIDTSVLPNKHELLGIVTNLKWEAEEWNNANKQLKKDLEELREIKN